MNKFHPFSYFLKVITKFKRIIRSKGNKYNQLYINIREVVQVAEKAENEINMEKIMQVLISLLEEQEGVKITYTLEKTA